MLDPRGQTSERVHAVVDEIFKVGGCLHCGRLAILHVDFISDPAPDFSKNGATSVQLQGF
jgi:hypothetical protein